MKAHTVVGRGEEGPLCDPGSELLLGGRARGEECEDNKWDEENKIKETKEKKRKCASRMKILKERSNPASIALPRERKVILGTYVITIF